jgi:hypothetical protein
MSIENNNIEPLLPILPELRKPDPKVYSEEEIKKLVDESRRIAKDYTALIVKEGIAFSEDEILDKILMISYWLKKVDYLERLKKDGEDTLNEITEMHQFIKNMKPGDDGKLEIIIKTANSGTFHIKGEYTTYSIFNLLSTLHDPERDRKRGGQEGISEKNKIIRGYARDLRWEYMRYFNSVKLTYSFIIDILLAAGFKTSSSNLKHIINNKD